jgi:hypothetical protein
MLTRSGVGPYVGPFRSVLVTLPQGVIVINWPSPWTVDGPSEWSADPWREQQEQPMKATRSPIYRWRIGELEITRVLEFEASLFEPAVIHPGAQDHGRYHGPRTGLVVDRSQAPETFAANRPHQRPLPPLRDRLRPVSAGRAGVQGPCGVSPGTGELGVLMVAYPVVSSPTSRSRPACSTHFGGWRILTNP